MIITQFILL